MSAPARPETLVWHRHPIVLVQTIGMPALLLAAILATGLTVGGWSGWPVRIAMLVSGLIALFRGVALMSEPPPDARTPVGQRRTVLRRVTRPVELVAVVIALALVVMSLVLLLLTIVGVRATLPLVRTPLAPGHPVFMFSLFLVTWIVVNALDWHNDIYILTGDRIIDQVRVPLLYDQRTEARLDQVQNVTAVQGLLGGLLGYGNVVVETAGRTQSVVFEQVSRPQRIQQIIFDRLALLRAQREAEARQQEAERLSRWFSVYHELATRVEIVGARPSVPVGGRLMVVWRVTGVGEGAYRTGLRWDTVSHSTDNAYANSTPEAAGSGPGWHRDCIVPGAAQRVYFKACLRLDEGGDWYSSAELAADVVGENNGDTLALPPPLP